MSYLERYFCNKTVHRSYRKATCVMHNAKNNYCCMYPRTPHLSYKVTCHMYNKYMQCNTFVCILGYFCCLCYLTVGYNVLQERYTISEYIFFATRTTHQYLSCVIVGWCQLQTKKGDVQVAPIIFVCVPVHLHIYTKHTYVNRV